MKEVCWDDFNICGAPERNKTCNNFVIIYDACIYLNDIKIMWGKRVGELDLSGSG